MQGKVLRVRPPTDAQPREMIVFGGVREVLLPSGESVLRVTLREVRSEVRH